MENASHLETVRFVYAVMPPFTEDKVKDGVVIHGGFMFGMLEALASWMNFTPIIIHEPEDKYGTFEDGNWTGMIGMLYHREVDIVLSPMIPVMNVLTSAIYTNPVTIEGFTLLSGKAVKEPGFFLYFSALDPIVWGVILMVLLIVGATSAAVYCRLPTLSSQSYSFVTLHYVWALFAYMMQQDVNSKWMVRHVKRRTSILIPVLLMAWIIGVAFLVMNVFKSQLFSKLTVVKPFPLVDTIKDIVSTPNIRHSSADGIEIHLVLANSGMPLYDEVWERVKPNLLETEEFFADETLTETETGKRSLMHGYLVFENVLHSRFIEKGKCNFHLSDRHFHTFSLCCVMGRHLPKAFTEKFNLGLTRLVDADIPGKWFKPLKRVSDLCENYFENSLAPLSMKNIYGVLMMWLAGTTIASITLLMEIGFAKLANNSKASKRAHEGHRERGKKRRIRAA